jgi:polyvinyl alcohol dehydrogenase (cytochrome)
MARFLVVACLVGVGWTQTPDGAALFKQRCSTCHDGAENSRAPSPEALRGRTPESIVQALEIGPMRVVGSRLSGPERRGLAEFISAKKIGVDVRGATAGRCEAQPPFPDPVSGPIWNGWGATPANTRFQSSKQAGLTAGQVPHLTLKWAFGFPDASSAWAQPAVAGGRLFVGSQNGTVYSLDAKTGCIYWTFSVQGGARTGMVVGPREVGRGFAVYFGDTSANAYAVDAATGEKLWVRKVEEHPLARITGTPTLYEGRLYVGVSSYEESQSSDKDYQCCTFRGSLSALDAKTGAVLWKSYTIGTEPKPITKSASGKTLWGPAGAGIWSAPTIDAKRGLVYAATGNSYSGPEDPNSDAVLAFEIETGKVRWSRQTTPKDIFVIRCEPGSKNPNCPAESGPDFDFGNAPILATLAKGRDVIVIGQKSGVGFALDPEKRGDVLWQYRAGEGSSLGGMEWGSATDGENAYFPVSDMYRPNPGGLHAVSLATGQRVWYAPPQPPKCAKGPGCNAAQSAAITVIPGVVFSPSNDGVLRAYSTKDGSIIWDFDTNREFQTVNRVPARGASMIGPGPVIAGGMLYVNSGYVGFGGRAGNVLLAFGVK